MKFKTEFCASRKWLIAREFVEAFKTGFRHVNTVRHETRQISLRPASQPRGTVLLAYFLQPFLIAAGEELPNQHSNLQESLLIAQSFLELGYEVDVISSKNIWFRPRKKYSFFVDVRRILPRIAHLLDSECCKIFHIDVCHILYQNAAESKRLLALQQRRSVTLKPRRFEIPNTCIEHADCATILGNAFTLETYRYAGKPIYPVPIIPVSRERTWPAEKDFESSRRRFLWFGSSGLVRKGLDLVLEAFAGMREMHLTICGPIGNDADFECAYWRELYETPNIETLGSVDVDGQMFRSVCDSSVGMVYASCAEGQCGGVVACMHAGVIPIVSYETGVDVHDFGVLLADCSIATIQSEVRRISELSSGELARRARAAWEYARSHHLPGNFLNEYKKVIEKLSRERAAK